MTNITIRTVGNRSLYRHLYESFDSETRHRTATGAVTRLMQIARQSRRWGKSVGQWGTVEIVIDGERLGDAEMTGILADADEAVYGYPMDHRPAQARITDALSIPGDPR